MTSNIKKTAITIGALAVTAFSSPAFAERHSDPAFLEEIDSCVAELTSRIDMTNADRLRHVVTNSKRSGIGYALKFNTSVFSAEGEARYSVYCVARGDQSPVKFRFKELDS